MYRNIWLIDDDKDDGELFAEAVQSLNAGIRFRFESNPLQALELLQRAESLPEIIFLDLNMPSINGQDLREKLQDHERFRDIPVVLYSSYSKAAAEQLSLVNDTDQFISKPGSFEALREILRLVLNA
ncbi:response regulator [Flavobacterium olei]|uniref:response regulator n=1 Tax=Flavobacterium olei TaxID=1886782 RepID=UPI003219F353